MTIFFISPHLFASLCLGSKHVTAYYKVGEDEKIYLWGANNFDHDSPSMSGILLDFEINDDTPGSKYLILHVRTPFGNKNNHIFYLRDYRNRTNDGEERIQHDSCEFRVMLWK